MLMVNQLCGFGSGTVLTTATTGTFGAASIGGQDLGFGSGQNGGFQFTAPQTGTVTQVKLTATVINTSGDWVTELWSNSAGSPGSKIGSSSNVVTISATGDKTFTFSSPPSITASTLYWIVIKPNSGTPSFTIDRCAADASYGAGRHNTITSISNGSDGFVNDIRMEITYVF